MTSDNGNERDGGPRIQEEYAEEVPETEDEKFVRDIYSRFY